MVEPVPQREEEEFDDGRVDDAPEDQRLKVHESALDRVPGREMCEEPADAVEAPAGILSLLVVFMVVLLLVLGSLLGVGSFRQAFEANG